MDELGMLESGIEKFRAYPLTAALLSTLCVCTVLFGLFTAEDKAYLLATGNPTPLRLQLWSGPAVDSKSLWELLYPVRTAHFTAAKAEGQPGDTHRQRSGALLLALGVWVLRFLLGNLVLASSGELLVNVAALVTYVHDIESIQGLRCSLLVLVAALCLRLVAWVGVLLVRGASFATDYEMHPGLSWMCLAWYIYWLRVSGFAEGGHEVSRLRLFGKIPLGYEMLHLMVALHCILRMDWWMETVPSIVIGLLLSLFPSSRVQHQYTTTRGD